MVLNALEICDIQTTAFISYNLNSMSKQREAFPSNILNVRCMEFIFQISDAVHCGVNIRASKRNNGIRLLIFELRSIGEILQLRLYVQH